MPNEPSTGRPPLPPDVTQQQSPAGQMADRQMAQNGQQGGGDPATQFMNQSMAQIAELMQKMAQALSQTKPQLMPLMQKIAGGFKELETQINQQSQGQGQQPPAGSEPSPAAAENPAAMGM